MQLISIDKEYVSKNVLQFSHLIKDWKYCDWNPENFLYDLPKKWDFSFAGIEKTHIQAFCFASIKTNAVYYIHLIFVSEVSRGQSIGKKLIDNAKKIAAQHFINRIELRCPETNLDALSFYKKQGFAIEKKITDEVSGSVADYYLALNF